MSKIAILVHLQGIIMTQLSEDNLCLRQAIMHMDVKLSELRLVGAVAGRPVPNTGCAFHTLLGANAAFREIARTTPLTSPGLAAYRAQGLTKAVEKMVAKEEAMSLGIEPFQTLE